MSEVDRTDQYYVQTGIDGIVHGWTGIFRELELEHQSALRALRQPGSEILAVYPAPITDIVPHTEVSFYTPHSRNLTEIAKGYSKLITHVLEDLGLSVELMPELVDLSEEDELFNSPFFIDLAQQAANNREQNSLSITSQEVSIEPKKSAEDKSIVESVLYHEISTAKGIKKLPVLLSLVDARVFLSVSTPELQKKAEEGHFKLIKENSINRQLVPAAYVYKQLKKPEARDEFIKFCELNAVLPIEPST